MARKVKEQEYAGKRNSILDAAQRLVYSKGYERMTIQDILDTVQISSGAFYHYFRSKPAVLEAFIARIREETSKPLLPIVRAPHLTAVEKLRRFFAILERHRLAHMADAVRFGQVWYTDDNAIVRQKVDEAMLQQRAPLLTEIVQHGVGEGVFTTSFSEQAGEVIYSLYQGMGDAHAKLLLSLDRGIDEERLVEDIITLYAAFMEAIERVVGAPAQSLGRTDADAVRVWVAARL